MEAGRALDAVVAVKVMGYHRSTKDEPYWNSLAVWVAPDGERWESIPDYSTSIEAAWQIVDTFDSFDLDKNPQRNAHFGVEAGDRLWSCSLTRYTPELFGEGEASTASLAICRAALAAVSAGDLMEPER